MQSHQFVHSSSCYHDAVMAIRHRSDKLTGPPEIQKRYPEEKNGEDSGRGDK